MILYFSIRRMTYSIVNVFGYSEVFQTAIYLSILVNRVYLKLHTFFVNYINNNCLFKYLLKYSLSLKSRSQVDFNNLVNLL